MDSYNVCVRMGCFITLTRVCAFCPIKWVIAEAVSFIRIAVQILDIVPPTNLPPIFCKYPMQKQFIFQKEMIFLFICSKGLRLFITVSKQNYNLEFFIKAIPSFKVMLTKFNFASQICTLKNCFFPQKNSVSVIHSFWHQLTVRLTLEKITTETKVIYNWLQS